MSFGGGQGSASNNDLMAVSFKRSNGDWGIAIIDLKASPVRVVSERVLGNASGSVDDIIDNVGTSQTGDHIVVCFLSAGTGATNGTWVYDRSLDQRVQVLKQQEHWDWGRNRAGEDVLVYRAGSNDVASAGTYAYNAVTGREYVLVPGLTSGVHISGRNVHRPGWIYIGSSATSGTTPGYGIVFAVDLDTPSRVQVFAHHHHSRDLGYYSQVHATPSPDGRYVIFASEWGASEVYAYVASG
jgi:hypothetical protein